MHSSHKFSQHHQPARRPTVNSGSNIGVDEPIEELIDESHDASPLPTHERKDPALSVSQLGKTNIEDSLGLNDRLEESLF